VDGGQEEVNLALKVSLCYRWEFSHEISDYSKLKKHKRTPNEQ
jgi:hypothetical protein